MTSMTSSVVVVGVAESPAGTAVESCDVGLFLGRDDPRLLASDVTARNGLFVLLVENTAPSIEEYWVRCLERCRCKRVVRVPRGQRGIVKVDGLQASSVGE